MRQSSMRVRVKLFGPLQELAGFGDRSYELLPGESVGDLLVALKSAVPLSGPLLAVCAFAINYEYGQVGSVLRDGDEVAILPPVSGGAA